MSSLPRPLQVVVVVLATALLMANAALTAQTRSPEAQPKEAPDNESLEEKWLTFNNKALTAKWGWMLILDGLAMTQDSANEQQVGRVPAKAEPRADRFFVGGLLKFRKPWKYILGANFNGLDAERGAKFPWLDIAVDIPARASRAPMRSSPMVSTSFGPLRGRRP